MTFKRIVEEKNEEIAKIKQALGSKEVWDNMGIKVQNAVDLFIQKGNKVNNKFVRSIQK